MEGEVGVLKPPLNFAKSHDFWMYNEALGVLHSFSTMVLARRGTDSELFEGERVGA